MKIPKLKLFSGFTLIELLIVIAIISIITVVLLLSFGNSRIKKELETNANEFAGVVREAQNYALTGKQAVSGTTPCGYQINWSGSSYSITYRSINSSGVCVSGSALAQYSLKNSVVFSGSDSFTFNLPYADLSFGSGTKTIIFTKQSLSHVVCVYSGGRTTDVAGAICPSP